MPRVAYGATMIILGIDPGPEKCGVALYDTDECRALFADSGTPVELVLERIDRSLAMVDLVVVERVQSYGIAGGSLLRTAEVCGRFQQKALDVGLEVLLIYRRQVLRDLDVTGKGNRDSLVRHRLIEIHGGTREVACGKKSCPGPLYGVSGHAWQALGALYAVHLEIS